MLNLHMHAVLKLPLLQHLSILLPLTAEHRANVQQVRVKSHLVQGSLLQQKIHVLVQVVVHPLSLPILTTVQLLLPLQIHHLHALP